MKNQIIIEENGVCQYIPSFISKPDEVFKILLEEINWRRDEIKLFGKTHSIPRLHAWYGDVGANYRYSHITLPRNSWTPILIELKKKVEGFTGLSFNSVLCNFYRDGSDSNGWHCDNEVELIRPIHVAGLSFGDDREIQFRRKGESRMEVSQKLESGSLILMKHPHQDFWQHQVPKRRKRDGRINLTFRKVRVISS